MIITKSYNIFICFFFFQWLYASDDINYKYPIGVCIIPEMEYIPEIDDWSLRKGKADSLDSIKAVTSFKKHIPWVQNFITPKFVKSISKYANKEMNSYNNNPPLDRIRFSPHRISSDGFKILFEGVADTLPSHSKIVTRWLKVYFMYNKGTNSIIRVVVTIRGQLLE
jgi:hypothetical protein